MIDRILDRLLPFRVIRNCERQPYLKRWYLFRCEAFAVFVHRFIRSDEDRALHDHPWPFIILPVWRGYVEESVKGKRRVWPLLGLRKRPATYRHRVILIDGKPAWSLFVRFRKERVWGFWPASGFVDWQKWWNDLCED